MSLKENFKNYKTKERIEMNNSFTLTKLDDVKIILKNYKPKIKKMTDVILSLPELKSSKIFKKGDFIEWPTMIWSVLSSKQWL